MSTINQNVFPMVKPPLIFVSYSHSDDGELVNEIIDHLNRHAKEGACISECDRGYEGGAKWREKIETGIRRAAVAVLLISKDFLKSEFIMEEEIKLIRHRYQVEELYVYPILLSNCSLIQEGDRNRDFLEWVYH